MLWPLSLIISCIITLPVYIVFGYQYYLDNITSYDSVFHLHSHLVMLYHWKRKTNILVKRLVLISGTVFCIIYNKTWLYIQVVEMWNQLFHLHVIKFFSSARGISCNLCDLYDNVEVFANEKCVCFQLPDQLLIFTTSPYGPK